LSVFVLVGSVVSAHPADEVHGRHVDPHRSSARPPRCYGELGRTYLPANPGIDTADLLVAEVAQRHGAELLTMNVKHFRVIFPDISRPYSYDR